MIKNTVIALFILLLIEAFLYAVIVGSEKNYINYVEQTKARGLDKICAGECSGKDRIYNGKIPAYFLYCKRFIIAIVFTTIIRSIYVIFKAIYLKNKTKHSKE